MAKKTKKFELPADISNKTKITQAVSDLNDHIQSQNIPQNEKAALSGMASKYTERITKETSQEFNAAMLTNACQAVNEYL